jgi:transcriptional regulator with XRE-family HTH domain
MSEFAKRLADNMKNMSITQTAIAKMLRVSQQSVSYWINGIYEPSIQQILELCKILQTTPNELLGFSDF